MGLGVSLILIAVGAVMAWAIHVSTSGFNVHTVGYILLVVGIIGALLSMVFWSSSAGAEPSSRNEARAKRNAVAWPRWEEAPGWRLLPDASRSGVWPVAGREQR